MAQHSIFIGYRRDDTGGDAGRIYDRLEGKFGKGRVFKDVDSIPRGAKFRDYVPTIIVKCRVFLALIGPRWLDVKNDAGVRRLDDPEDLVRIEIETALATQGVQLVPVLVAGARLPSRRELPASLQAITEFNAAEMRRDPDFNVDMGRLIRDLEAGEATGRVVVQGPGASTGAAAAAWTAIADSLEIRHYQKFEEKFGNDAAAFALLIEAEDRIKALQAWPNVNTSDPDAIARALPAKPFPAFEAVVKAEMQRAATARQAPQERDAALERWRQQAAAEAARRAREEDERRFGPVVARAREAAKAGRPVAERAFPIELPGVSGWPNPQMVVIPPGRFLMGSPKNEERWSGYDGGEEPQHEVRIDYAFALGQHTVTVDAFNAFVAETKHDMGKSAFVWNGKEWKDTPGKGWWDPGFAQTGAHPVCCVNWQDAQAFLAWLNARAGLAGRPDAYRLPSEAEWEYACRAGTTTPFSFGAAISPAQANYNGNYYTYVAGEYRQKTMPVGWFPANPFGLHEMHGNVWEWCQDCWNANYNGAPGDGSAWLTGDCSLRVLRGGSWYNNPQYLRSAGRISIYPTLRSYSNGFRLARTIIRPPRRFVNVGGCGLS